MMLNRHQRIIFLILLLLEASIIVINGSITDVSLGDESHHYRFAQNIYREGKRVPFDPLYESGNPPGFFYNDPPLWHLILAFVWKMTGGISQTVAQVYHILFFMLLVWVTSILAREVSGEEGRWSSALVLTTVPMVVSFSTLLYMDIPVTALSILSFYLILKRRYLEAGVSSGLVYFTKLSGAFFFPGFLFIIFWHERKKFWVLARSMFFFVIPICMIYFPDQIWRRWNITSQMDIIGWSSVSHRLSMGLSGVSGLPGLLVSGWRPREYLNSYLTNPVDLPKYFGLVLPFLICFYLVRFRQWDKKAAVLWVPIASYIISFVIIFGITSDVRYLLPIVPFLVVFFIPSFFSLGNWLRFIIIAVCFLQFACTSFYIYQRRQVSPEVMGGFEYIRKNVPQDALILYPEENLLIYGQRRVVWSAARGEKRGSYLAGLSLLFWGANHEEMNDFFRENRIDHILIKKSRVYDDREEQNLGGYPKSFVEKLSNLDGWVKVFENPAVALWKRVQ